MLGCCEFYQLNKQQIINKRQKLAISMLNSNKLINRYSLCTSNNNNNSNNNKNRSYLITRPSLNCNSITTNIDANINININNNHQILNPQITAVTTTKTTTTNDIPLGNKQPIIPSSSQSSSSHISNIPIYRNNDKTTNMKSNRLQQQFHSGTIARANSNQNVHQNNVSISINTNTNTNGKICAIDTAYKQKLYEQSCQILGNPQSIYIQNKIKHVISQLDLLKLHTKTNVNTNGNTENNTNANGSTKTKINDKLSLKGVNNKLYRNMSMPIDVAINIVNTHNHAQQCQNDRDNVSCQHEQQRQHRFRRYKTLSLNPIIKQQRQQQQLSNRSKYYLSNISQQSDRHKYRYGQRREHEHEREHGHGHGQYKQELLQHAYFVNQSQKIQRLLTRKQQSDQQYRCLSERIRVKLQAPRKYKYLSYNNNNNNNNSNNISESKSHVGDKTWYKQWLNFDQKQKHRRYAKIIKKHKIYQKSTNRVQTEAISKYIDQFNQAVQQ